MAFPALTGVHFRLSSGWRQNVVIMIAYLLVVALAASAAYRAAGPNDARSVDAIFLTIISIAQGVLLLLAAPNAIQRAVQRDFQTGMIESHRLTPVSNLGIVLGYLSGPVGQAALLYGLGLLIGGYFVVSYGTSWNSPTMVTGTWYGGQFSMLPLAFLLATVTLLMAIATRGKGNLLGILMLGGILGGWFAIAVVPGLALLTGTLSASVVIQMMSRASAVPPRSNVLAWAMLLQMAFGLILVAAACRKVRAPNQPVFTVYLGLLLLALTGLTLELGWLHRDESPSIFSDASDRPSWEWLGSVITFLVVALFPSAAAAAQRADHDAQVSPGRLRWPAGLDGVAGAVTLMAFAVLLCVFPNTPTNNWWQTWKLWPLAVALALSSWTDYQCLYWARAGQNNALLWIVVGWALSKLLPVIVQGVIVAVAEAAGPEAPVVDWIVGFSPLGTLYLYQHNTLLWPGLLGQLAFAVAVTMLARQARARLCALAA